MEIKIDIKDKIAEIRVQLVKDIHIAADRAATQLLMLEEALEKQEEDNK